MCTYTHVSVAGHSHFTCVHVMLLVRIQIREQLITFLDDQNDSRKKKYRNGLEEHVKSSTDAVCKRVRRQKRELNKAVVELTDRLQVLRQWLSEAGPLE